MTIPQLVSVEKKPIDEPVKLPEVHLVIQQNPQPDEEWNSKELVVSVLGFLCCQLVGLPAMIMAIFSYVDHSHKAYEESRRKRRRACRYGTIAIVLGVILILIMMMGMYCKMKKMKRMGHYKARQAEEMDEIKAQALTQLPEKLGQRVRGMLEKMEQSGHWDNDMAMKLCDMARQAVISVDTAILEGDLDAEAKNLVRRCARMVCSPWQRPDMDIDENSRENSSEESSEENSEENVEETLNED